MNRNNRRDRETLKEYFRKGKTPTEEQFAALIDSMPNIREEGHVADTGNGWSFYPTQGGSLKINFYTEEPADGAETPVWSLSVTPEKNLLLENMQGDAVLEMTQDKAFILHGSLTVEKEITAPGYLLEDGSSLTPGGGGYFTLPADKQWHDLPLEVSNEGFNCRMYDIYASFRERSLDLCELVRATAIWQNDMEQRIESPQKHWWGWSGCIRLRWQERNGKPCLQMRSKKQLPSGRIHCRMVELYNG